MARIYRVNQNESAISDLPRNKAAKGSLFKRVNNLNRRIESQGAQAPKQQKVPLIATDHSQPYLQQSNNINVLKIRQFLQHNNSD